MSLLDIAGLTLNQIAGYMDRSEQFRNGAVSDLTGKTVATLFFEASTRTRLSFELAAHRLGARVISFSPESSSLSKGESFRDTVETIAAMGPNLLVVRHKEAGSPGKAADWTGLAVVNGGDGRRAHPTQTLADLATLRRHFGHIDGLSVAVVGDITNSRVARGLIDALPRLGAALTLVGPSTFVSGGSFPDLYVTPDLDLVLNEVDVVYLLRVQRERGGAVGYPSDGEYHKRFGLTDIRLRAMKKGAVVMHPGPINRGVEISDEAANDRRSLILEQVSNGVFVRMAVLADFLEQE